MPSYENHALAEMNLPKILCFHVEQNGCILLPTYLQNEVLDDMAHLEIHSRDFLILDIWDVSHLTEYHCRYLKNAEEHLPEIGSNKKNSKNN